jgi:hypothetical protein
MEDSKLTEAAENISKMLGNLQPAMKEAMDLITKSKPVSTKAATVNDYKCFASLTESKSILIEFESQEMAKHFYDNLQLR